MGIKNKTIAEAFNPSKVFTHDRYHCKNASTLSAITVNMFEKFVGVI